MIEEGLGFTFTPQAAITSSEALTVPMRRAICSAWGCRAYQEYGSVENCGLATECEAGGLHVSPDFGVIEIVDSEGHPVGPGVEGRVLCHWSAERRSVSRPLRDRRHRRCGARSGVRVVGITFRY